MGSISRQFIGSEQKLSSQAGIVEVNETYRKLSLVLDYVDQAVGRMEGPFEKAALVVIEEDLHVLLEECEDFMVQGLVDEQHLNSLACRSHTVLDELRSICLGSSLHH